MATEQVGFKTSMLGFRKKDVLACIDCMSAENLAVKEQAEARAKELEETLASMRAEKEAADGKVFEKEAEIVLLQEEIAAQKELAAQAFTQLEALKQQVEKAETTSHEYKTRLFNQEKEVMILRRDNTQLTQSASEKQITIEKMEMQMQEVRLESAVQIDEMQTSTAAELTAQRHKLQAEHAEMKDKMQACAVDMVGDVEALKQSLATLESKIESSLLELQHSTKVLAQTLEATEKNVCVLGGKLEVFPQKKPQEPVVNHVAEQASAHSVPKYRSKPQTISGLLLAKISKMIGEV